MLPVDGEKLIDDPAYAYEPKWDGYRAIVFAGDELRVQSRNLRQLTPEFPELRRIRNALATTSGVVLDGEIVCLVNGRPDFQALRGHTHPVSFVVFDILYDGAQSVMGMPLVERKSLLENRVVDTDIVVKNVWVSGKGKELYEVACSTGMEGVVAKLLESPYVPGRRSRYWLKFRRRLTLDCVVGGLTYGETGGLASIAVGCYDQRHLRYVGNVGSGLGVSDVADLITHTTEATECPFDLSLSAIPRCVARRSKWVKPTLCCEVSYAEFTRDLRLRQPVLVRIRPDKDPLECQISR